MRYLLAIVLLASVAFAQNAPVSEYFPNGTPVKLKATSDGNPTPTFQWMKDGVTLQGATTDTLDFVASATTSGVYSVRATNVAGSATSPTYTAGVANAPTTVTITVTVVVTPPPSATPSQTPAVKK